MLTDRLFQALAAYPKAQHQARRLVKKLPHRRRQARHRGSTLIVDPSELCGHYLYYEREYDDPIFDFLEPRLPRYERILDIGANIGVYSCFFGARGRRVDAFEPDAALARWLRRNLALNGLTSVAVHEACIGRSNGTIEFYGAPPSNRGIGSLVANAGAAVECACMCLDDFLADDRSSLLLVKMDIEGAEWPALQGATRALARSGIDLLLEVHPAEIEKCGGTAAGCAALLRELGYTVSALDDGHPVPVDSAGDFAGGQRFWWISRD